jgi:uncharacterized Zn finger protein
LKSREVSVVISDGAVSETGVLELEPVDEIRIGDEFDYGEFPVKVTAIELGDGTSRRVEKAKVDDIGTIWLKRYDKVKIKVSVNRGRATSTEEIFVAPDDIFGIGDVLFIKGNEVVIHAIKIDKKKLRKGSAEAREITRIYGKFKR